LPTKFYGTFRALGYRTPLGEILVLVKGNVSDEDVLVRIHSECLTGDVIHSLRCDCGEQLESALKMIEREGKGILIYMRGQEGRGIGLINKLMAYKLQENGVDTVDANIKLGFPPDMRSYGVAAQILMDLGVKSIRLLTNNPSKIEELAKYGFRVKREAIEVEPTEVNLAYLRAKKDKMGHFLCIND
ncbi:MAG: GTP cyclohydrolase II, partial [Archaeoglobaceae archaeon]